MADPNSFQSKVESKLLSFRNWVLNRRYSTCRLVHYCGVDRIGTDYLKLQEIECRIEGLLCEGFYVDWGQSGDSLYLRVWEFGGPEPPWTKVFAEESLVDVDDMPLDHE